MTGLKDIEPAAILENENWWDGYEPEETDWLLETVDCTTLNPTEAFVKLYSAEQMQEYAKEKVLKAMFPSHLNVTETWLKKYWASYLRRHKMKKFEEEFDKNVTSVALRQDGESVITLCDYKEAKAFGHDWVSPEDHQAEIAKLNSKIDWLHGLLDERNEEVLQTVKLLNEATPEIPEVPKFVADWLDKKPLYTINSFIPVEIIGWSKKQTGYADLGMNINHLLKLKVNGYTVETPKAIVTPCPVCGYEEVESNFCSICGRKNDYE